MFKYILEFLSIVGVLFLASCNDGTTNGNPGSSDESKTSYPLISLSAGNKWVYTLKEINDAGIQVGTTQFLTWTVIKDTTINGIATAIFQEDDGSELMVQKSDGLYKWNMDSLGSSTLQLLYKYPLVSGEKYPQDDGAIITVLWPKQRVTLSFASYDCIEIQKIYKKGFQAIIEDQYYAKNIGLVKSLKTIVNSETGSISNYVQELSSINF